MKSLKTLAIGRKVTIDSRFNGPPHSGNGGYVCGMFAKHTDFIPEVSLYNPPPLDKELVVQGNEESITIWDEETLIGKVRPGEVNLEVPPIPNFEEAAAASHNYIGTVEDHVFHTCFVCGPSRKHGDGLRIFTGQIDGTEIYAAPWIPDVSLAPSYGQIGSEFIWASLDCPGAFACMGEQFQPMVLGRMTCEIKHPVFVQERCVLMAWCYAREGRKQYCGTALVNEAGEICALAKSIWITVDGWKFT